ncbi:sugar transferase [Collinsella sp. AF38-3AC]|uniref:sugar transferase n=1 Tax=Collinsella sp. AF38-3AC TaxID=2292015 RepID=UPI001F39A180|nr:sugar transferase [Collinsella sp. AF38-3AC]
MDPTIMTMEQGARETCAAAMANSVPAAAGAAGDYLTNEQAYKMLRGANSGIKPELSRRLYRTVKRTVDIVAAGGALALLLIPGAILSAVICAKSPGAGPLYSQWRVGRVRRDGTFTFFKMYKFRSMVPNADQMLKELQAQNEASGPMFKILDDPRIIPGVGNFIRKHSIDELPQLVNVFLGDMSLIGPRPGLPREVALYDERAMKRLAVKPGCGGPWQVMGRSYLGFDEMVALDLHYVENRSLGQDFKLIFGTIRAMLSGDGAA